MKFKKLFFVLSAIIAGMHATSAWATDVAKIGEAGYETFAAALSAVQDGDVIYLLADADASDVAFTPCNGKKVIIAGTTGNEILDMGNGAKGGITGTTEITFYNLKMQIRHTNTTGIWYTENIYHAGKIKYENVVFDGAIATADYVEFLNCTFASNPQSMEYTVWNYGGTQVFKGCTFETASAGTKSFIKDYAEPAGTLATNLVMAECAFNIPDPTPSGWKGATIYFSTANSSSSKIYLDEQTTQASGSINYSSGCENKAEVCSSLDDTDFTLPTPTFGPDLEIGTAKELVAFAQSVNNSPYNTWAGKTVVLTADIDLDGVEWKPIGNVTSYPSVAFAGTFDGQGYTISNLTCVDNTVNYACAGFFGSIDGGTVQNVNLANVNIQSTHYAGGICAYSSNANTKIINCSVEGGTIKSTPELIGTEYDNGDKVGGIMGYGIEGNTITGCAVKDVTVSAYRDLGGIAGYAGGSVEECSVSGCTIIQDNTYPYKGESYEPQYAEIVGNGGAAETANEDETNTTTKVTLKQVSGNAVAKIGDVEYASLAEAVAAVPTDGTETTITMIDDEAIEGNAGITIAATQNVVLDLNGKTVKNLVNEDKASQVIANKGTLTIKDSSDPSTGILKNAVAEGTNAGEWWGTEQYNYATNVITNTGTLIVVSGEIYETAAGSICYAIDNNSSAADAILTVNGGYIHKDSGTAIRQFCNSTTKENTVNVNGGTIEGGKAGIWIQLPGSSTEAKKVALNVTGGTLKGTYAFYDYTYGDIFDASQYNITGGTFNGDVFSYGANVAISGGEFNGEVAIQQVNSSNVSVTGGTFAGDIYTYGANASTGFITGGTFKISEYEEADGKTCVCEWISCLAEGLAMAKNADGTFGVEEAKIAKIGDTTYPSLAAAVAAAPADGTETTITMIDDANILGNAGVTIAAGQNIVLDLNGKTVKNLVNENKASQLITNKGTLKITGDGIMTNELADGTIAGDWPTYNYATNLITNVGTLTIENGTFNNTQDSGITYTLDNNSNGVPATATINGGKFVSAGNAAVRMFCNSTTAANTLTINGGYFEGNYYAVSVSNASGATKVGSLTINDGEFESRADEYNACVANWESNKSSNIAVSITGGKFNDYVLIASNANVTGGTYKYDTYTDPDDGTVYDLNEYLAAGFELNENADGTFGVQEGKMMVYTLDAKEGTEMSSSEFITLAESNPNAIAIVGSELEEFAQSMTNVIVRYTVKTGVYYYSCPNFVLDDWYGFYSPVEFVAEAGSYKREGTEGMNSVCLPFDFDSDDVQGTIGSFVATDLISEDEEGNRVLAKTGNIYFNNVPSMMAGTPCIVECAEDVTEWDINLAGRKIITTPNNAYAVKGQFYDSTIGEGYYKVSPDGKKFVNTDSESISYTYRAYLDLANTGNMGAGANQFNIRWTDNPTAILNIINEKNSESYFDLTGRKVAEPVKGSICIVNGKKFIY